MRRAGSRGSSSSWGSVGPGTRGIRRHRLVALVRLAGCWLADGQHRDRVGGASVLRRLPRYTARANGHRAPCEDGGSAPLSRAYALTPPAARRPTSWAHWRPSGASSTQPARTPTGRDEPPPPVVAGR